MLDELLTNQDRTAGFSLWEDDHCVYVQQHGKQVAVFSNAMNKDTLRAFLDLVMASTGGKAGEPEKE